MSRATISPSSATKGDALSDTLSGYTPLSKTSTPRAQPLLYVWVCVCVRVQVLCTSSVGFLQCKTVQLVDVAYPLCAQFLQRAHKTSYDVVLAPGTTHICVYVQLHIAHGIVQQHAHTRQHTQACEQTKQNKTSTTQQQTQART